MGSWPRRDNCGRICARSRRVGLDVFDDAECATKNARLLHVRFTSKNEHRSARRQCLLCAKIDLCRFMARHKVRASTEQVAGLMYGYPEVLCGTMVAREIFDELPVLPAPITCGADPVDNPVENSTDRKRSTCSQCCARLSLRIARHVKLPS